MHMEFKADALLLKAVDYGEQDRMVTLLTAERGKLGAAMKGVRRAGAKLNFAAQPFCFAEYVLAEKGGRYTVTQAALHDGFYDLRTDLVRYYAAASVVGTADLFACEGMPAGELLLASVGALGAIDTEDVPPMPALLTFLLQAVAIAGYPVTAGECAVCGRKQPSGRRFFDMASGSFTCADCAVGVPASQSTYDAIRACDARIREGEPTEDGTVRALRLLRAYIAYQTESAPPALGELLELF